MSTLLLLNIKSLLLVIRFCGIFQYAATWVLKKKIKALN